MSNDFDPLAAVSATAAQPGDVPEIRISAADRPPRDRRRRAAGGEQFPCGANAAVEARAEKPARRSPPARQGLAGWGLYRFVAPQSAGWFDAIAAKTAQLTAPPVDLVPVTQKLQAEIEALQKKVEALEKSREAPTRSPSPLLEKSLGTLEAMNRRIDEAKTETKTEIDALSGRVAALQQETNAKLSELSAAHPPKKRSADAAESKAAPSAERTHSHQTARRNDAFDPSQHPGAPGAPRPLGTP